MAIHHPISCTLRLWSASLQVAPARALHLKGKSSTDKFMITQKLGAVPSTHRKKHDNNDTIDPRVGGHKKDKKPMHPSAPQPTSRGPGGLGPHQKGTPPRPIIPIHNHTNIDRHFWKPHSASVSDDIVEAPKNTQDILLRNLLFVDTPIEVGNDFDPKGSSTNNLGKGPKDVPPRLKGGGCGVPETPQQTGGHKPKTTIHMDKSMSKGVSEWFILELLNELTRCWPHWKNIEWSMKDRSQRMSKGIADEVDPNLEMKVVQQAGQAEIKPDSEREKMKVVQQAKQVKEAHKMQVKEEVKQTITLELILNLQADMVVREQMVAPRSLPHPRHPPPHSNSQAKHPINPLHKI